MVAKKKVGKLRKTSWVRSQLNGDLKYEKPLEPQDLSAIHFHLPDSCSRRLETVALPTLGRVPHVKDPNGRSLSILLKVVAKS